MSDETPRHPEWFRVSLEIGSREHNDAPIVAAVGWDTNLGAVESSRDIGHGIARVLAATNALHGAGLSEAETLAHAVADALWQADDAAVVAFREAAKAYLKALDEEYGT